MSSNSNIRTNIFIGFLKDPFGLMDFLQFFSVKNVMYFPFELIIDWLGSVIPFTWYSCRCLYQYNEEYFSISVLIYNQLFFNYSLRVNKEKLVFRSLKSSYNSKIEIVFFNCKYMMFCRLICFDLIYCSVLIC